MIIFKEKAISIAQENCIMLELENEVQGFIYLSKSTYDQALLLSDRLEGEVSYLRKVLSGSATSHAEEIQYFYETAPEPLNILAPFIGLVKADVKLERNMRTLCGVLHVMSMAIDFNEFSKVPASVRANVEFGKSAIRKYEQSWNDMEVKIKVADIDLENVSVEAVADILTKFLPALSGSYVQPSYSQPADAERYYGDVQNEDMEDDSLTPEQREILNPDSPNYDFIKALELSAQLADAALAEEEAALEKEQQQQAGSYSRRKYC